MSRPQPSLGIAPVTIQETYSVCKLFDADPAAKEYLSVDALIYAEVSGRVTMVTVVIRNLSVKRITQGFCGYGPKDFQELREVSGGYLEESRTPRRLICQEGFKTLLDTCHFVTGHLWLEPRLERYEATGALGDVAEIVYACFGVRP
jgi:hypothetical protein